MPRTLSVTAVCALALFLCAPGRAQDSPSLGDLARQAQKDKEKNKANKPAAKVITNDDVAPGSGGVSSGLSAGISAAVQPASSGASGDVQSAADGLAKLRSMLDQIDSLDRATLANNLLEGNTSNFPGRAKWEEKLFAAKQNFVAQGRVQLDTATQLAAEAEKMKDVQDPNDPRLKNLAARVQQLERVSQQSSAAFQAVIEEGKDLAGQSAAH
jgi:hypothetical protein